MGTNNTIRLAFKSSFENRCIQLFVNSYRQAIANKSISLSWIENDITSMLNNYISNDQKRILWQIVNSREEYIFEENPIKSKGFSDKECRIDMKFTTISSEIEYVHFFEAKRLKENDSALKRRYIDTGIDSFLTGKYKNGVLLGYLLAGNLINTVDGINRLLIKDFREAETLKKTEYLYHESYYESIHIGIGILKHLIFDFTVQ